MKFTTLRVGAVHYLQSEDIEILDFEENEYGCWEGTLGYVHIEREGDYYVLNRGMSLFDDPYAEEDYIENDLFPPYYKENW